MLPHIVKDYSTPKGIPLVLHENRFFRMIFNGEFHYLEGVRYAKGAVVVPTFENGDLLLVQLRRAPNIGLSWEFPRGGVEPGEDTAIGAMREMLEETGYSARPESLRCLGRIGADTATINGTAEVYAVTVDETVAQGAFDTNEIERPRRVPFREFLDHVRAGDIVCGLTLAAYALSLIHAKSI